MSIEPPPAPPGPVYRFPLRTLLFVTTGMAIVAAVAGMYYRSVESEAARSKLATGWLIFSVFVCGSLLTQALEAWQVSSGKQVRYVVHARGRLRPGRASAFLTVACFLLVGLWAMAGSYGLVLQTQNSSAPRSPWEFLLLSPLCSFAAIGGATSGLLFSLIRRPMFLCEEGVPLRSDYLVPWNHIVHAEWQTDRPATLKLHQVDGDMYLDVPAQLRSEVEHFVRGKIRFIDDLGASTRIDRPSHQEPTPA